MTKLVILSPLALLCLLPLHAQEKKDNVITITRKFGWKEPEPFNTHKWLFSREVVADETDGTVRLAKSVLITNEVGATDFLQGEELSSSTLARVQFDLNHISWGPQIRGVELLVFGEAKDVRFGGSVRTATQAIASTGWSRIRVSPQVIRERGGQITLGGGGRLLFEPTGADARSEKSTDKGQTWTRTLGAKEESSGNYLVRLRLHGEAPKAGFIQSPVYDACVVEPNQPAILGKLGRSAADSLVKQVAPHPRGRFPVTGDVPTPVGSVRFGNTPDPTANGWTGWIAHDDFQPPLPRDFQWRWFQLGYDFKAHPDRTLNPILPSFFELAWLCDKLQQAPVEPIHVRPDELSAELLTLSIHFTYQPPSPRLKYLRDRYQLDKVIAAGKTEMEQLMLLRHWVRHQWHTAWGNHPAQWMPPWDAHIILESKDQPDCLTMCTHYACVFTQCCLALGFNARHCILDHHCVAEVFVNDLNKWVMMDAGNSAQRADVNLHFEKNGVPMSALELHNAYHESLKGKKLEGIMVHFTPKRLMDAVAPMSRPDPKAQADRPEKIPLDELPKYPVCGLQNYRRYAFPARNDYLRSLLPGELYQGWSEYFYDGYWWVGDSRDDPKLSPEYSKHLPPSRPQDIDWSLNWTKPHLARTKNAGELQVDLETFTPNLARLELKSPDSDSWKPTPAAFVWKLKPGKNTLQVRSVNQFERVGVPNKVEVEWKPGN